MSKQALLIVDMQQGLFATPRHDADGLVSRINALSARMRAKQSPVIFIQHCGVDGDDLHPSQPGHALHGGLMVEATDTIIAKAFCDAFLETSLASTLSKFGVDELIVTGFATDFCVDTTIRSALARSYTTIVPEDGHTTADRPYSSADKVIEHHNFVWANLISPAGAAHLTRCDAIV
jgi:nicotinamidase-related amidase